MINAGDSTKTSRTATLKPGLYNVQQFRPGVTYWIYCMMTGSLYTYAQLYGSKFVQLFYYLCYLKYLSILQKQDSDMWLKRCAKCLSNCLSESCLLVAIVYIDKFFICSQSSSINCVHANIKRLEAGRMWTYFITICLK